MHVPAVPFRKSLAASPCIMHAFTLENGGAAVIATKTRHVLFHTGDRARHAEPLSFFRDPFSVHGGLRSSSDFEAPSSSVAEDYASHPDPKVLQRRACSRHPHGAPRCTNDVRFVPSRYILFVRDGAHNGSDFGISSLNLAIEKIPNACALAKSCSTRERVSGGTAFSMAINSSAVKVKDGVVEAGDDSDTRPESAFSIAGSAV